MSIRFLLIFFAATLVAAEAPAGKRPEAPKRPAAPATTFGDVQPGAKTVQNGEKDVIRVKTKLRYTTLIVLPKNEQILDFTCGDKEFWVVNGSQNFAYVKPAKASAQTNLNPITASGNIYTFVLLEVSEAPEAEADLKVFVEPKDESMVAAAKEAPRFVSARELDTYRQQVELAKEEARRTKQAAEAAVDKSLAHFMTSLRFTYRYEADKKPFHVRAIYHDKKFTYIQAKPDETPTLYEIRDGKPNLVNFQYKNGIYVVEKVIDRGYLAIGKERLIFMRRE